MCLWLFVKTCDRLYGYNWFKYQLAATYLFIVRPNVTCTSAIRVFLTHLNTKIVKKMDRQTEKLNEVSQMQVEFEVSG